MSTGVELAPGRGEAVNSNVFLGRVSAKQPENTAMMRSTIEQERFGDMALISLGELANGGGETAV
jgi:hypothetical protein